MTSLSLIVPCYNCADTLQDAVASIYRQDVRMPFDVTMVDDGSTDSTYEVMARLAAQHPNIRLARHRSNVGGGAARNTGIANSTGELIFSLDADDMLGDGFLENITQFCMRKRCDAVGMSKSVKFRGSNVNDVAYINEYEGPGRRVRFESFLEGPSCSLSVVFLITRRAFDRLGGYPTAHGFDNQGMGFRLLCNAMSAYTCPDTVYYHRVEHHESWYLRDQANDRLNWNWFSLLEESLYIFSREVQSRLLECDLFRVPGRGKPPRIHEIVLGRPHIYAHGYREMLRLGRDKVAHRLMPSVAPSDQYWLGTYYALKGEYGRAIERYTCALALGFDFRIIHYRMLEASLQLSGHQASVQDAVNELALYCQPFPMSRRPIRHRLMNFMLRTRLLQRPIGWLNRRWIGLRDSLGGSQE